MYMLTKEEKKFMILYIHGQKKCIKNGAGELYVTNIEFEGKRKGYDIENLSKLVSQVQVPVIFSVGQWSGNTLVKDLKLEPRALLLQTFFTIKNLLQLNLGIFSLTMDLMSEKSN